MVQEQNQVRVETKVKKIYLVDNKNDIKQKQAQEELKKKLVMLFLMYILTAILPILRVEDLWLTLKDLLKQTSQRTI